MSEILPKSIMLHIPHTSDLIGTTVSSVIYSTLTTSGDIAACATKSGIQIAGTVLGYGTELIAGPVAGATVRCIANTYSSASKHTIAKSSRIGAVSLSIIAYTGIALTTGAIIHGSNIINSSYNYFFKPLPKSIEMVTINRPVLEPALEPALEPIIEENDY